MAFWYSVAKQPAPKDFLPVGIINITEQQHEFLEAMAQTGGNILKAFAAVPPLSMDAKQQWVMDPLFWPAVLALKAQIARANALTVGFIKDHLVATADGAFTTHSQQQAINTAVRVLGLGVATKSTKVEASPDSIKISFDEGLLTEATETIPRDPAPAPAPADSDNEYPSSQMPPPTPR